MKKRKKALLQQAYEKELSRLRATTEMPEPGDAEETLDSELDFDVEHYNRIETYDE